MSREHNIEVTSSDKAALLMLFVDGRIAAVDHGRVSVPVRTGQHVRWFVRPRRRNAGLVVTESRGGEEQLLWEGKCDPVVTSGDYVPSRATRRRRSAEAGATRARRATQARTTTTTAAKRPAGTRNASATRSREAPPRSREA